MIGRLHHYKGWEIRRVETFLVHASKGGHLMTSLTVRGMKRLIDRQGR